MANTNSIFGYRLYAIPGSLPPSVNMQIELEKRNSGAYVLITAQGSTDALLASGYLTPSMMAGRAARRRGDPRGLRDDHGQRYFLTRRSKKGAPERMALRRHLRPEHAIELPGVRDIFPNGIPEPDVPVETGPTTTQEWKGEQIEYFGISLSSLKFDRKQWCGMGKSGPRFRFADGDIQQLDSIVARFGKEVYAALERAVAIDTQVSSRQSFLRLVVDNTR